MRVLAYIITFILLIAIIYLLLPKGGGRSVSGESRFAKLAGLKDECLGSIKKAIKRR